MVKKAVVTGGAGFIGSHIVEGLLERDYKVVAIDDLSTGRSENLIPFQSKQNFEFVHCSILDIALMNQIIQDADYVFHQAAIPSVPRSIEYPVTSNRVNVEGTLNVLTASRNNRVKKVVYASSSSVYGDTPLLPKKEDMIPNPQSPYAVSKLAAEYYCSVFTRVYGLPTASLRYFNVFGPRQDPDSQYSAVIPRFIKAIASGQPPVIFGDGEQTRDFCYVVDVARANIMAAESNAAGVYNIGGGKRISLNDLTKLILTLMKRMDIVPVYQPERAGDIMHSLADISRAESFGYAPQYGVKEGLKAIIDSVEK